MSENEYLPVPMKKEAVKALRDALDKTLQEVDKKPEAMISAPIEGAGEEKYALVWMKHGTAVHFMDMLAKGLLEVASFTCRITPIADVGIPMETPAEPEE